MITYIKQVLKYKSSDIKPLVSEIQNIHSIIPTDFGGGCSLQKALLMAMLIKEFEIQKSADIGVYKGRSLFPQALAHKLYSKGVAYGIDPYSSDAAVQTDRQDIQEELKSFVAETDFQELFEGVTNIIDSHKFNDNCTIVRKKSSDAAVDFRNNNTRFGLVHIDGNHDTKFVVEDANNYIPLLLDKSFVVLDDISWDSVKPAFAIVEAECKFIGQIVDRKNDFALFAKGYSKSELSIIKFIFNKVRSTK